MSLPPFGYDDESVIPKERVINFLHRFEKECVRIEKGLREKETLHFEHYM